MGSSRDSGDFGHRGTPPQVVGEILHLGSDLQVELLNSARGSDRPSLVPEVALELAHHVRHRERRELHSSLGIEAFDRLHQRHTGDLVEVVVRLTPVGKAAGEVVRKAEMVLDDRIANFEAVRLLEFSELLDLFVWVESGPIHG